jgi:hypothetical protein
MCEKKILKFLIRIPNPDPRAQLNPNPVWTRSTVLSSSRKELCYRYMLCQGQQKTGMQISGNCIRGFFSTMLCEFLINPVGYFQGLNMSEFAMGKLAETGKELCEEREEALAVCTA